ncbi:hypothetical protein P7C70_g2626, partial [Phenoliferia sp. Uapishka_3]
MLPSGADQEALIILAPDADVGRIMRRLKEEQMQVKRIENLPRLDWVRNEGWVKPVLLGADTPVTTLPPQGQLFVGNLDFQANEEEVRQLLSPAIKASDILNVTLAEAKGRSQTRPAFVLLSKELDVARLVEVLKTTPITLRGKALRFDLNQKPGPSLERKAGGAPKSGSWRSRGPIPLKKMDGTRW